MHLAGRQIYVATGVAFAAEGFLRVINMGYNSIKFTYLYEFGVDPIQGYEDVPTWKLVDVKHRFY